MAVEPSDVSYFSIEPTLDQNGRINGYDLIAHVIGGFAAAGSLGALFTEDVHTTVAHFDLSLVNSSALIPTFIESGFAEAGKLQPGVPVTLNGKSLAIIDPDDGTHGDEIWVSDGTAAGPSC